MNISEHTRVFKAYVERTSLADLKEIVDAMEHCWREQANGNAGSQESADFKLHTAIMESLEKALPSDRDNITKIITRTVNRT